MAGITGTPTHSLGLLDPTVSQSRRHQLNVIDKLHSLGVQFDIDVPRIVVVGSQSAGKSSLIESFSGITLPRSSGTCTRCPTECVLVHSDQPWECLVSLQFLTDESGRPLEQVRNVPFGAPLRNPADVEERVRRAQKAALNPNVDSQKFLENDSSVPTITSALNFTTNCVTLKIEGPDLIDLSFCDLPGLIASVSEGGRDDDVEKVAELVSSYISKQSCIILLTVACETDFETQGAHRLAKQYDPKGTRTIGVLTKPDRISPGEEGRWIRLIKNEISPLDNGWYCVRQPSSIELSEPGFTSEQARLRGEEFFENPPWLALEPEHRNKLGTRALTQKLHEYLMTVISKRLPELTQELQMALRRTKDELEKLQAPTFKDPIMEMMHLIGDLSDSVFRHAEGVSYVISRSSKAQAGFNQFERIRDVHEDFRKRIRSTAPDFRPFDSPAAGTVGWTYSMSSEPSFLTSEEKGSSPHSSEPIYLDDVTRRATTREFQWEEPACKLVESVYLIVFEHHRKLVELYFGKYTAGGLRQEVSTIMQEYMQKRRDEAIERVKWLLELEAYAFTLNRHYLDDYRNKFMEHFKTQRQAHLNRIRAPLPLPAAEPWNPNQYALEIMATVRAYFQVAYKRVVDTLPLATDCELVRVKRRDIQETISLGLGITGSDAHQRCEKFLAEPPEVVAHRKELRGRLDRLTKAQSELMIT
ncbi:P-loop containing nucleoside triphosphate hydrolase protein [Gautieria morchelliformis]|nr:P-loop containing nucleoside triphosphate hydrolase protein [Gautieria morchelliformis]